MRGAARGVPMPRLTDPRRVARRRLQALSQQVPLALAGDVEGVHQARVASRRLRDFVPLLEPVPDGVSAGRRAPPPGAPT